MPNTIQKGSEKCEHSFELMNVAGLPEEVIFICPKCGTPQEGKITIKKPMTQTNTTQINKTEMIMIAKDDFPLELFEGNSLLIKLVNFIRKIKLGDHLECKACYERRKGIKCQ